MTTIKNNFKSNLQLHTKVLFLVLSLLLLPVFAFASNTTNIAMSVGILHDEPVPDMPTDFELSGTYKSFVRLEYNDGQKVLRLKPLKEGFGTLIILDKSTHKPVYEFTVDVRK